jgi:hypothetical protein
MIRRSLLQWLHTSRPRPHSHKRFTQAHARPRLELLESRELLSGAQAVNDLYHIGANMQLAVAAANGILANDSGSPLTIVSPVTTGTPQTALPSGYVQTSHTQTSLAYTQPFSTATPHGTLVLKPDGSFSYTPSPGFVGTDSFTYTVTDAVQDYKTDLPVLATFNGVPLTAGGYGSSLYPKPGSTDEFYGLEDRGPNGTDPNNGTIIVEPLPHYTPAIGLFKFANGQATLERYIPLKAADGTPYSGRVNSQNPTGETLKDLNGNVQPQDIYGYDSEGLVALPDGTFWVSDEYGPYITHFNAQGRQIGRLTPLENTLPAELRNRTINRGLEGLTVTPDGNTLVAMMQSALQQPDIGTTNAKKSAITRLITYQLQTANGVPAGTEHEYLYLLDNPGTNSTANSELTALDSTHFLVDERDGNFPPGPPYYKKLWEIDISGATDIGPNSPLIGQTEAAGVVAYDTSASHLGLTIGGKSLEKVLGTSNTAKALTTLTSNGITPVAKGASPYLDVGALITSLDPTGHFFSHDKIEGVAVTNGGNELVISNDSDFNVGGVVPTGTGGTPPYQLVGKTTPAGVYDDGEYLAIDLTKLPAVTSTATVTIQVDALTDITSQMKVEAGSPTYNPSTQSSSEALRVRNTGSTTITGQVAIVLANVTAGISLRSATVTIGGVSTNLAITVDAGGNPVINIPSSLVGNLVPGSSLPAITLTFNNPTDQVVSFDTSVFVDPLAS